MDPTSISEMERQEQSAVRPMNRFSMPTDQWGGDPIEGRYTSDGKTLKRWSAVPCPYCGDRMVEVSLGVITRVGKILSIGASAVAYLGDRLPDTHVVLYCNPCEVGFSTVKHG